MFTKTIEGLWRKTSAGKSCNMTLVINWQVCKRRLVSKVLLRVSSTADKTPLSDGTNGCQGITNHFIPPSVLFETTVPLPHCKLRSKGTELKEF